MGRSHRGACVRTHEAQRCYTEQVMCRVLLPAGFWHIVGFLRRASSRCSLKEEVGSWMLITPLSFSSHDQTACKQDFKMITQMLLERIMLACRENGFCWRAAGGTIVQGHLVWAMLSPPDTSYIPEPERALFAFVVFFHWCLFPLAIFQKKVCHDVLEAFMHFCFLSMRVILYGF